ncbi:MAG: hypothetical protein ABSB56_02935 [Nitrososphaerales archaeon]
MASTDYIEDAPWAHALQRLDDLERAPDEMGVRRIYPVGDDVGVILGNDLPNPLGGNLLLSSSEKVKLAEEASLVISAKLGNTGQFILTTERIVFKAGARVTGRLLTSIVGVGVESNLLFMGQFCEVLKVSYGPSSKDLFILHSRVASHSTQVVAKAIQELRSQADHRERLRSACVQIVFDFSMIRDYLDKGGLLVSAVKCPQCGGAVDLPKEGNLVKCRYCGSAVYAQDILQRLKELAGD